MSAPTPPKPSVPAEPTQGPAEGTMIPRQPERVAPVDSDPKKRLSARETQVYVATSTLLTRQIVDQRISLGGGQYMNRKVAAGPDITVKTGTVFQDLGELRAKGFTAQDIEGFIRTGSLVSRTLDRIYAESSGKAPMVLGNSTGSKQGDADLGLRGQDLQQNNPNVKWGWHPNSTAHLTLGELQARISSVDPGMTPPDSESECIRILSQDLHN